MLVIFKKKGLCAENVECSTAKTSALKKVLKSLNSYRERKMLFRKIEWFLKRRSSSQERKILTESWNEWSLKLWFLRRKFFSVTGDLRKKLSEKKRKIRVGHGVNIRLF